MIRNIARLRIPRCGACMQNREGSHDMEQENLSMLCDFYEFTMGNGYLKSGMRDKIAYFDVFFRNVPDDGGFVIAAGLEQAIRYLQDLHFTPEDIEYLRSKEVFDETYLSYLRDFRFTGDVYAVPEGTCVFPNEPIFTVRAPIAEAQLLETFILLTLNHQSLIATKANRVVRAAQGRPVLEFGSRRAQGADGAVKGARAAFIGGCKGTACALTDELYGVPAGGTMAHSWVQAFDTEYEAFRAYCELYPKNAILLVDTYNVLKSGIPNAIRAFREVLLPRGISSFGIRIDSGDIAYLTKKARRMLDDAGLPGCKIVISNSLDEYLIADLIRQGACIDTFGVGERIGVRLAQVAAAADRIAVRVEHDGADRHLVIRGGFAGERDRQPHIVIPSHSPQCSGGRVCATENVAGVTHVTRVATTAGPPSHVHSETCS